MPFVKYPSIDNSYHEKIIQKHFEYHPIAKECSYVYQLKLDGSNIQFIFEPDGTWKIAKRSQVLAPDENFNGVLTLLETDPYGIGDVINYFRNRAIKDGNSINLYGEIYGKGIQNRIDYGPGKHIRFFDIRVNGELLSYEEAAEQYGIIVQSAYWVPTFGYFSFHDVLNEEVPIGHEGIVIKQFNREGCERLLYLKKKAESFQERMKPKKKKDSGPEDPQITEYRELFSPYVNRNRVLSVFSKEGEIDHPSKIGDYIKCVMQDSLGEFDSENDTSHIDKKHKKVVHKEMSREVAKILQEYL